MRCSDMHLPSMVAVDGTDSVPQKAKKEEKRGQGEGIGRGREEKRAEEGWRRREEGWTERETGRGVVLFYRLERC